MVKLVAGKCYVLNNGKVTEPLEYFGINEPISAALNSLYNSNCDWYGAILKNNKYVRCYWNEDGFAYNGKVNNRSYDIKEPIFEFEKEKPKPQIDQCDFYYFQRVFEKNWDTLGPKGY